MCWVIIIVIINVFFFIILINVVGFVWVLGIVFLYFIFLSEDNMVVYFLIIIERVLILVDYLVL